ncbi:MAG: FCD domain-containing protein [Chloroflexota bacterium]|nr:FCD domain-containing protein [Chloroflexota bacterium]
MTSRKESSGFLEYLIETYDGEETSERILPLTQLGEELGVSVSRLREQLAVAKAFGLVDVRPRLGIRRLDYSFAPAARYSLLYAINQEHKRFEDFLDLRRHIENAYFVQAVEALTPADHQELHKLVENAWAKLEGRPIRIPHEEHCKFHLTIYSRLKNVFVTGILEAYWDAYESVGLNVFADYEYLQNVWTYHQRLIETISQGDTEQGLNLLREHFGLLVERITS